MVTCLNCGEQMQDSYKFCMSCGALLPVSEPELPVDDGVEECAAEPCVFQEEAAAALEAPSVDPEAQPDAADIQSPVYAVAVDLPKPPRKKSAIVIGVICAVALLVVMVIALSLFFDAEKEMTPEDPNLGTYVGTTASMWGIQMDIAEILGGSFIVELKEGGKCTVVVGKTNGSGTWTLEGDVITIKDGKTTIVGTLRDGEMTFENVMEMAFDITLYRMEEEDMSSERFVGAADTEWWNGDWYGWWTVTGCDGIYEDWEEGWWDCGATITVDEAGQGHLLLWDTDYPKEEPLAEIDLAIFEKEGSGEMGAAVTTGGNFIDMKVSDGAFTMDPDEAPFENLLVLEGEYETLSGGFYFECYLRPWGQRWDDMIEVDENWAPYFYEEYLTAIGNGESIPEDLLAAWNHE